MLLESTSLQPQIRNLVLFPAAHLEEAASGADTRLYQEKLRRHNGTVMQFVTHRLVGDAAAIDQNWEQIDLALAQSADPVLSIFRDQAQVNEVAALLLEAVNSSDSLNSTVFYLKAA